MNTVLPKRTPEHIIGSGLLAQLIAAGYQVVPARRSSDEQAEVVAWRWRTAGPNNDGSPVGTWYYGPSEPPLGAIGRTWAGWECEPLAIASPPAVAAGGVTEAVLDKAFLDFIRGRDAAIDARPQMVDLNQVVRAGLREVLTAALAVGDEGIREGAEAFTEDEIRNELYRREEAGRDARVPLTMPVRFHPFSNADLRSMLPTPPSRGEGE